MPAHTLPSSQSTPQSATEGRPAQNKRRGYSHKDDLEPIIQGKVALPNYKEVPLERAVADATRYAGSQPGNAKVPSSNSIHWAQFFLDRGQGGGLHGSGLVLFWDAGKGRAGTFAICEHKKVDDSGADHRRGWHPGHCEKCGLDMTVDSGD